VQTPTGKHTAAVEQATQAADRTTVEKTTECSEQMFEQVETGQRAAIEAVRKFMRNTVHSAGGALGTSGKKKQPAATS